jgi:hypothetical protein
MNKPQTIRLSIFACIGIFFMLVLSGCEDVVYKETGKELSLTEIASPSTVSLAGQVITYTYTVTNNTILNSSDRLSAIAIAVTDSPLDGPVVCSFASLKGGESTICKAKYTVTEKDIANGAVTSNASVTGSFTSTDTIYPDHGSNNVNVDSNHTASATANVTVNVDLSVPTPTTEPTMTPTQPLPILTGDVTYCSAITSTMNLRLDHSFVPSSFNHQVTINGDPMVCKVNQSNSTLLTCSYPPSVVFPANIKVSINDIVVNDFTYDGAACVIPATPTQEPNKPASPPTVCVPSPGMVCP